MCPSGSPRPSVLPPKLRRVYDSAKRLAELKAERDSWTKTALALSLAEPKKPGTAEPSTSADNSNRGDCNSM